MKKLLFFILMFGAGFLHAQENCDIQEQIPLQLIGQELQRSYSEAKKYIYYLSGYYDEGMFYHVKVKNLGLVSKKQAKFSRAEVLARAGSPKLDNTHFLDKWKNESYSYVPFIDANNKAPFLIAWWNLTEQAISQAVREYSSVQSQIHRQTENKDKSDDFVFPPLVNYCREDSQRPTVDLDKIEALLLAGNKAIQGEEAIDDVSFSFDAKNFHHYFADSNGVKIKTPYSEMRLHYYMDKQLPDGSYFFRYKDYDVNTVEELPSVETLQKDIKASLEEMKALAQAPEAKPDNVPVLLKASAAAVFAHEVMGHRLEGDNMKEFASTQTLAGKVGKRVISPLITISSVPSLKEFNGEPVRGHYEYDDEGVKAQDIVLIENGVLKNFLMRSAPIEGFPVSNGHGRKSTEHKAAARMSVLKVSSNKSVSYDKLEKKLLQEIKSQGKTHGFIIEDLDGGYTFTRVSLPESFKLNVGKAYKVYPDGRKELVRGIDVIGTPLVSFNRVVAVGNDDAMFNGSCGSVSGWVPQSNISPSILFKSMEVQRTEKSPQQLPILPKPSNIQEKK